MKQLIVIIFLIWTFLDISLADDMLVEADKFYDLRGSDFDRETAKAYGVFGEERGGFRCVAKPSVFIINKSQRIVYRWVSEDLGELPDLDQVISVIQGFSPDKSIC